ncbi:hypothetical protein Tco_0701406 [Tanacetum coccineum]
MYKMTPYQISIAKAVLMANLSSYSSDVLFEVPQSDNTNNDMLNQTIQDTNSFARQDAMISPVFEQLSHQVTNCNKVNKDNLIANESLFAKLERYKERVKLLEEKQNVDLGKGIPNKNINVFKNESKEKEAKNIDNEIAMEKKDSHKDGDGDALFQLKSDSLPHPHAQTTKIYYKHRDSRIMKAQELKTKTSAQTLIYKIFLQRYQVYQGRLLASLQDDAKYEHVGQDTRLQGGKDDQDGRIKI